MEKNKNKQDAQGKVDEEKKVDKPGANDSSSGGQGGSNPVESPGVDEKNVKKKEKSNNISNFLDSFDFKENVTFPKC